MPLQMLKFRPGVNREGTTLTNEGGWFESDKIRFRSGQPEKLGGWVQDTGSAYLSYGALTPPAGLYWGVCRSMHNWLSLANYNLLGLGTSLKFYIQNGGGGQFFDVTPLRATASLPANAFTTTNGSNIVQVNDSAHGCQVGDFLFISGVSGSVGGIPDTDFNKEFQVASVVNNNVYTIQVATNASSSTTGGGCIIEYQVGTGAATFTTGVGFGAGYWGGSNSPLATTTLTSSINSSVTTIPVTSTTGFSPNGVISINGEQITYSGKNATNFTGCVRGYQSTPAAHSNGATVSEFSDTTVAWGEAAPTGVGQQLRLWSQDNYGQNLVINPRGGSIYYWVVDGNPNVFNRAQVLSPTNTNTQDGIAYWQSDSACPSVCNLILVSDASRFLIAFGVNDIGSATQDPLLVRWSDQEDLLVWNPSATNQAGSYRLSIGSQIITAQQTRQEILVWTDAALYSMQYLGPPFIWGFQPLGENISIMGPNAAISVENVTYWMGTDKFYMYSGRVTTLPCTLRQYVFDDINLEQAFQFFCGSNEGFSEIWWFYCSSNSTTIDRYVIYNYLENNWYYGTAATSTNPNALARTAWLDSPIRGTPMGAGYNGQLLYHENGNDDGTTSPPSPIEAYIQSSDFDIGDGYNFGFVRRMLPDVTFDSSTIDQPAVEIELRPRKYPGSPYGATTQREVTSTQNYQTTHVYTVQEFTDQVFVRVRGRQMAFKVSSRELGVAWQLGTPRVDIRQDGRR
jgi:hypothetical protein